MSWRNFLHVTLFFASDGFYVNLKLEIFTGDCLIFQSSNYCARNTEANYNEQSKNNTNNSNICLCSSVLLEMSFTTWPCVARLTPAVVGDLFTSFTDAAILARILVTYWNADAFGGFDVIYVAYALPFHTLSFWLGAVLLALSF